MQVSKTILIIGSACLGLAFLGRGSLAQSDRYDSAADPNLEETYFGQTPPGKRAELFAPDVLKHEPHDSPVISRDETWMIINGMEVDVLFYEMRDGRLSLTSNPMGFEVPRMCNGIAISPSRDRVYIEEWKAGLAPSAPERAAAGDVKISLYAGRESDLDIYIAANGVPIDHVKCLGKARSHLPYTGFYRLPLAKAVEIDVLVMPWAASARLAVDTATGGGGIVEITIFVKDERVEISSAVVEDERVRDGE